MTKSSNSEVRYLSKNTLDFSSGLGYKILYRPVIGAPPLANPFETILPVFPRRFPRYFIF